MKSFAEMSRSEKRDQIISENHTNETQVTMDPLDVDALLAALEKIPKHKLADNYSSDASLRIIADNWGIEIKDFPDLHHKRDLRPASWDTRALATLAILSEFTPGQGPRMGTLLCSAVELRVGNGRVQKDLFVKEIDVKRVIRDELNPLREPMTERTEENHKRRVNYREQEKVSKKKKTGVDMEDAPVEDALDEIVMQDMGKRFMGAAIPDDTMEED